MQGDDDDVDTGKAGQIMWSIVMFFGQPRPQLLAKLVDGRDGNECRGQKID